MTELFTSLSPVDTLCDALIDTVKLLPFLFLTYLVLEYLEHRTSSGLQKLLMRSGRFGPIVGALSGLLPQCGFSAAASNLYAARVITPGTLLAVYLATSDEMLPIMISEHAPALMMIRILAVKAVVGICAGMLINLSLHILRGSAGPYHIHELCEHCGCEGGIVRSALHHTVEIAGYIFLFTLVFDFAIALIGDDTIRSLMVNTPVVGELIAGLIGLVPNCAASVLLTEMYLNGLIGSGCLIAGLLSGAGIGLLLLFRVNRPLKSSLKVLGTLYVISVSCGILVNLLGIVF